MKDEIKEKIKAYYIGNDIEKVLDYITNLQEENDDLKNRLENAVADCNLRLEENKILKKQQQELERYKNIIDEIIKDLTPDYEQHKNLIDYRDDLDSLSENYMLGVVETSEYVLNKLKELKERNKIDE